MDSDNLTKQTEEIEALSAIYGDDWTTESDITKSFCIRIEESKKQVLLYVTMPSTYPNSSPPKYELSAPWMDRKAKENLLRALDEVYLENVGETVIYQWVEKIREVLLTMKSPEPVKKPQSPVETINMAQLEINCPPITHGEVIMDRKSSFQGHAAEVHSIEDVKAVLAKLKQNKKIQNATHNMYAYRIELPRGCVQDCADDGEAHAGARMLRLLRLLGQARALVVVSRWYGGIQLGPDRFRHISNATRQVLQQAGMLKK
ncbi:protein IMPACT-like [Plodia interpunctella]|uniref:protein IMPACT-like n=1 Tax=Plodia interpunctella TaxID=58824 RepID=UPI0023682ED3|nr:protein IMPACT-like [Plodia interpunctella]